MKAVSVGRPAVPRQCREGRWNIAERVDDSGADARRAHDCSGSQTWAAIGGASLASAGVLPGLGVDQQFSAAAGGLVDGRDARAPIEVGRLVESADIGMAPEGLVEGDAKIGGDEAAAERVAGVGERAAVVGSVIGAVAVEPGEQRLGVAGSAARKAGSGICQPPVRGCGGWPLKWA